MKSLQRGIFFSLKEVSIGSDDYEAFLTAALQLTKRVCYRQLVYQAVGGCVVSAGRGQGGFSRYSSDLVLYLYKSYGTCGRETLKPPPR